LLGGTAPAVLNAANEVCVEAFLDGRLAFIDIIDTVAKVLADHSVGNLRTVADVVDAERWARRRALELTAVAPTPTQEPPVA
jgi:1-deoxy-D-xylulose-5-phosphate reductoisomerase